ncbi:MAG TPA: aldehyde dehydrogenase family protein [Candidatus Dormibacteraeota bacterium]
MQVATADYKGPVQMLVDGQWIAGADAATIPVENPATGEVIASVPRGGAKDVDRAVQAATAAFPRWRAMAPRERGRLLMAIGAEIEVEREAIARTIAQETGNAIRPQSRPEATTASEVFRYFGGLASELKGETIPLNSHMLSYNLREPIGVVGAIIPWNSPVSLGAIKIAMALAAGNTLVLKAAEDAPLAVLRMAEVCARHLPAGVLNVVTGYGEEAGRALTAHPGIRKLSFTGSTEVGREVIRAAADRIIPVSLELGGKSPVIVFPDATDEAVVDGVVSGMRFTRQGQSCTAGSRLFLHASMMDEFLAKLSGKLSGLVVGDPLDERTDMGSLINRKQFDRVCGYIEDGLQQPGVRVVMGGLPEHRDGKHGYFVKPTVFANVDNEWRIAREEIFGPVLCVIPWTEVEDAIRMANQSHYGLAAFVWSHDISRALNAAHSIEAGWVQVNQGIGQILGQSYGGVKESGVGREMSLEGMLEGFTQRRSVTVNLAF